jgi:hypothetical protein
LLDKKSKPIVKKNQQRTNSIVKKQSKKLAKTQPNSNKKTKQKSLLKFSAQYIFVNILHLWRSVSLLIPYYCCFFFFGWNLLILLLLLFYFYFFVNAAVVNLSPHISQYFSHFYHFFIAQNLFNDPRFANGKDWYVWLWVSEGKRTSCT